MSGISGQVHNQVREALPAAEIITHRARFQFCWYGWRGPWLRCFFQRGGTAMFTLVYRWRIAIGPLDIRRWVDQADLPRLVAEHNARQESVRIQDAPRSGT